jgi:hypothetical protein
MQYLAVTIMVIVAAVAVVELLTSLRKRRWGENR